ncbi:peptidylprolyl isomerase [Paracoccus benzoatiresistens]|uniref:Parvulin-like PPIase n=1 Tax=Paracoccus benzoatiresistens TaxID=2997341 RepID=A0ABT4IZ03_9RHOB|nr:peptidylprolyl isomerase [Paracoccus sp. EF6]MCZ0960094.1 peptidylprolyl isomerase [Paracoccus sp. EF6]
MRHFLSGFALAAALMAGAPAPLLAQNLFEPVIYINNAAITRYEVGQRQRFMQILGAPNTTAEDAQKALIDDRLRNHAARQLGIEPTEEELQNGLEEFAARAGMSAAEFTAALEGAGIESQAYRDFVSAGLVWRSVIRQRVVPQIDVSDAEVDQELRKQVETPVLSRVLISELIIPAPPGQEQQAMNLARQIAGANLGSDEFEAAAREYSAAESAQAGGRLAWVNIDNLPPSLRQVIGALQPGQTTQPLTVEGAVVLFHLRDSQGTLRPGATEQVIDYATLRLPSAADAAALAARTRSCDDLYLQAGPQAAAQVQRQTISQGAIPTLIATRLATMDRDEAGVVDYGNGADLVMLCSRQPALVADMADDVATTALPDDGVEAAVPNADALPTRDAVRDEIFNRKANAGAEAYLAELRAQAVIRRP